MKTKLGTLYKTAPSSGIYQWFCPTCGCDNFDHQSCLPSKCCRNGHMAKLRIEGDEVNGWRMNATLPASNQPKKTRKPASSQSKLNAEILHSLEAVKEMVRKAVLDSDQYIKDSKAERESLYRRIKSLEEENQALRKRLGQ